MLREDRYGTPWLSILVIGPHRLKRVFQQVLRNQVTCSSKALGPLVMMSVDNKRGSSELSMLPGAM